MAYLLTAVFSATSSIYKAYVLVIDAVMGAILSLLEV
jgi:hypothetical protein